MSARHTRRAGVVASPYLPLLALLPLLFGRTAVSPGLWVLQLFAGPLAILGVGGLVLGWPRPIRTRDADGHEAPPLARRWFDGWYGALVIFAVTLAFASFGRAQLISSRPDDPRREYLLTGDEPAYLLLTHSLVFDRDFNVFNNREQNDARYFYRRPLLGPGQFGFAFYNRVAGGRLAGREAEWEGREYLVNRPGLSVLIAPAYWLGFRAGLRIRFLVLVWLSVLAAALAAVMFLLARRISGDPGWSLVAALVLALSPPLAYYSSRIYPELPAGLFLAGGVLGLLTATGRLGTLVTGALIAYLPWFHERFLAVSLILVAAARRRPSVRRQWVAFVLPVAVSLALQAAYYWTLHGVPFPLNSHKPLSPTAIPTGLLALSTDRDRGVLLLSPVLLVAGFGLTDLWRRDRWLAGTVVAVVSAYLLPVAAFPDWHGGVSPPLRYAASVAPLSVIPLVLLLTRQGSGLTRVSVAAFAAWSLWLGVTATIHPGLLFWNYGVIFRPEAFHAAHALFPGYFNPAPASVARSLLWLGLLGLAPAADRLLDRLGVSLPPAAAWRWLPVGLAGALLAISLLSTLTASP